MTESLRGIYTMRKVNINCGWLAIFRPFTGIIQYRYPSLFKPRMLQANWRNWSNDKD